MEEKGFIHDFKNYIIETTEPHELWAESLATASLSAALDNTRFIVNQRGQLNLNTFFVVIGYSGFANKTISLKKSFKAMMQFERQIEKRVVIPSRYTVEGLMMFMEQKVDGTKQYKNTSGITFRDEVSGLFKELVASGGSHSHDKMEFMCELYDGAITPRFTVKHQEQGYKDVYINFVGATTPYTLKILSDDFFRQGLGNRILFTYDLETKRPLQDLFLPRNVIEQYERLFETFSDRLARINRNCPVGLITLEPRSEEMVNDFRNDCIQKSMEILNRQNLGIEHSYLIRCPEFVLKLAALHCISYNEDSLEIMQEILIRPFSVEWAIKKVKIHLKHYFKIIRDWKTMPTNERPTSDDSYVEMFLGKIEDLQPVSKLELRQALGWYNRKLSSMFNSISNTLIEGERVKIEKIGRKKCYMTKDYYNDIFNRQI